MISSLLLSCILSLAGQAITPKAPPPGTERIGENLFLDKRLITHLNYRECLHYLKSHHPERYAEMLPTDTSVRFNGQLMWNNPAFQDYPIAGLSEQQMIAYCAWRSEVVNLPRLDPQSPFCNPKLVKQLDKADPARTLRVVYTLPGAEMLTQRKLRKEKYQLDEISRQGRVARNRSGGISHPEYLVFRCPASYQPAE